VRTRNSLVDHGDTVVEDESVELSERDDELNGVSVRRLLGDHPESKSSRERSPEYLETRKRVRKVEVQLDRPRRREERREKGESSDGRRCRIPSKLEIEPDS